MAKPKNGSSYWAELTKFTIYKRNQGRLTRQLSAVGMAVLVFFGAYTLSQGPLSGYEESYLAVTVRYAGSQADESVDAAIRELAGKHGAEPAEERVGRRFRELVFYFPTSRYWTTQQELVDRMQQQSRQFAKAVEAQFGARVRVSEPRARSQRAVSISVGIPVLFSAVGAWMIFRLVNWPRFADFLISVEAEMDKVSWPNRSELYRSTIVVLGTMFFLGFVLLAYDVVWKWIFEQIYFLRLGE